MDDAHGHGHSNSKTSPVNTPPHLNDDAWAAEVSARGATSPPPRPAIPPKPGTIGSKINTSSVVAVGSQVNSSRRHSVADASSSSIMQPGRHSAPAPLTSGAPILHNVRSPTSSVGSAVDPHSSADRSPISPVLSTPSPLTPGGSVPNRPNKPALPPKPVVSPSLLSSPPLTKFPPSSKASPKFPIQSPPDSANLVNNNHVSSPPSTGISGSNGEQNGNLHNPPSFLRAKPPHPRPPPPLSLGKEGNKDPLLSPRIISPSNSRPNSSAFFNFSSPIQNLNSANFPSTSAGLNKIGGGNPPVQGFVSPQKRLENRFKSVSLGRNVAPPLSTSISGSSGSGGGFLARTSTTLSRFLPLDLQIGGGPKSPPVSSTASVTSPSRPRPNTFNQNPFIIQQKQQQQKQNQPQMSQVNPPLNFGRSIAFSPDSPVPPPPPPRLKKKLSPVNSVGSPTSPTSPFPIGGLTPSSSFSLPPTSPLPPPPPISPAVVGGCGKQMEPLSETAEDITAIYAEVNKEKKWADRKLKQEEITRKLSLDSSLSSPTHEIVNFNSPFSSAYTDITIKSESSHNDNKEQSVQAEASWNSKDNDQSQPSEVSKNDASMLTNSASESEKTEVVKSWLHTHIANGAVSVVSSTDSNYSITSPTTLSPNNPFRSPTPTYQSVHTGHIYETIGENLDDGLNNNNNGAPKIGSTNNNKLASIKPATNKDTPGTNLEIQETSEVIPTDEPCENQSFLFKLVINPKKVTDAEPSTTDKPTLKNESISNMFNENDDHDDEINVENRNNSSAVADAAERMIICEKPVNSAMLHHRELRIDTVAIVQSSKSDTTIEQMYKKADAVLKASSPEASLQQNKEALAENNDNAIGELNAYLIPTVVQDLSEDKPRLSELTSLRASNIFSEESKGDPLLTSNSSFQSTATECSSTTTPPIRTNSILRRRSWNCDRGGSGSPSPSESSSTTSSITNLPYQHRRDRSFNSEKASNRDSLLLRELEWVDEGDLSNGALADAESSDVQLRSSAEDVNLRKVAPTLSSSSSVSKGFSSRRFVNSIFSSFGKGNNSSSGSSAGGRKSTGMMRQNGRRTKDKTVSHFIPGDPSSKFPRQANGGVSKLGRQISDSVISASKISGPNVLSSASFDSDICPHKPQSVQFSPEVPETRLIYHHEQYSSEEAAVGGINPGNVLVSSPLGALSIEEATGVVVGRKDDEISVSSSESVSGCGSISGSASSYEEILADLSPKEKKSFYGAREILTTERTFVDVLNLLTVDFPKFLDNARRYHGTPVIGKEDLDTLFGGLPNLKRVNEDLLSDLEERIAHWREVPKIADILVKKGPFLKLYATYIKDFQKNCMHFDTCCQRYPLFAEAVKDFELSERCQKLGLKHYMLKPVQRMPQYRLMLEDYLKSLDKEESNDYDDTVKGIAIVKDVAEHANEAIRLQVNAEKLLHLQNRLSTGTIILKSDRQLMKEGELLKVCRKVLQPRFFALMNDCLLCLTYHAAAGSPKDLKLRYELPLAGMKVSLSPSEDYQNEFSVRSVTRSFNLVAKSSREREDWMKALNNAIHDNIKKRTCSTPEEEIGFQLGKEAPVWIQDSRVTMCQLCTAEFTVTFRRHHCRACGKVVCGNCSSGQAPLQYLNNAANRVCDSCYQYLLDEFDQQTDLEVDARDNRSRASIRDRFKKVTPNVPKPTKKRIPTRLEVHANSSGSKISGYLSWRAKEKKSWKRRWFVLIDRVLYIYAASEDIVAIKSIPLLGWQVEMDKPDPQQDSVDNQSFFRLTHSGQNPMLFQADSSTKAEEWVAAMSEAVVLS